MSIEAMKLALKRAFNLGQTYWQQADSEYTSHWKKADVTMASFNQLVEDTCQAIEQAQEKTSWTLEDVKKSWKSGYEAGIEQAQKQEPVAKYTGETWCGSVVSLYEEIPLDTLLYTSPPQRQPLTDEPEWIVNDLGELGVKVGSRFFFLYKGNNIEYGEEDEGEVALHSDGTPMRYRLVGKREFGETCLPLKRVMQGNIEDRYTVDLEYHAGLSDGKPEDLEWKHLPAAHGIKG